MRQYEEIVLAATLPQVTAEGGLFSHLDYVLGQSIDESYFTGVNRDLFQIAVSASVLDTPLDDELVSAMSVERELSDEDRMALQIQFRDLSSVKVDFDKLKIIVTQFKEEVHEDRFSVIIEDAANILTDGRTIGKETLQGYRDSRSYLLRNLADLDHHEVGALPSTEIRGSAPDFLKEYADSKRKKEFGTLSGFREIDNLTRGIAHGELWIFCGFTGEGKSKFLINFSYSSCVKYGKNVVFITLEMPYRQVRRNIITRHCCHPRFSRPGGLPYSSIKHGELEAEDEKLLNEVVDDFANNPVYGKFQVVQVSRSESLAGIREKLTYLRSRFSIDLVALDYASLLSASGNRSKRQDEIVEVVEELKAMALTFNGGEGLPMLSANQISRDARNEAEKLGKYGKMYAAETSAIEKNADLLGWLLRTEAMEANHEVKMGITKYRDGETLAEFSLMEYYSSSLLANLEDDEAQVRF